MGTVWCAIVALIEFLLYNVMLCIYIYIYVDYFHSSLEKVSLLVFCGPHFYFLRHIDAFNFEDLLAG